MEEASIFLSATAAKANNTDARVGDEGGGGLESAVVNGEAIRIESSGGKSVVEGEPFLSLFVGVVMEFGLDLP